MKLVIEHVTTSPGVSRQAARMAERLNPPAKRAKL